jgi:trans-aconitate 2-methyltransferase
MTNRNLDHTWEAGSYHLNSNAQSVAADNLLQHMQLKGNEHILDVGCGDGKITAKIAACVPRGMVTGIDISQEMVEFAKKTFPKNTHNNLGFSQQDAQNFSYDENLDLIFSSFALQWLSNPDLFFKCAYKSLKSSGYLAITIPLNISHELERSIKEITSSQDWIYYFQNFNPKWYFLNEREYEEKLKKNSFIPSLFTTVFQTEIFSSRENLEKYVIQWFSYINPLPHNLRTIFFKQVIDKYLELNPPLDNGSVCFKFLKINVIAKKIIP